MIEYKKATSIELGKDYYYNVRDVNEIGGIHADVIVEFRTFVKNIDGTSKINAYRHEGNDK